MSGHTKSGLLKWPSKCSKRGLIRHNYAMCDLYIMQKILVKNETNESIMDNTSYKMNCWFYYTWFRDDNVNG